LISCREILLLINLCVSLANAYITSLSIPAHDTRSSPNAEITSVSQQTAPGTKKVGKGDQQLSASTGVFTIPSSTVVKTEDLKAALEVSHLLQRKTIELIVFSNIRHVNMQ
jgi:hypothetical protein